MSDFDSFHVLSLVMFVAIGALAWHVSKEDEK